MASRFLSTMQFLKFPRQILVFQTVNLAKLAKGKYLLQQFRASNRAAFTPVLSTISIPVLLPDLLEHIQDAVMLPELDPDDDIIPSLELDPEDELIQQCANLRFLLAEDLVIQHLRQSGIHCSIWTLFPKPVRLLLLKSADTEFSLDDASRVFRFFAADPQYKCPPSTAHLSPKDSLTRKYKHYRRKVHPDKIASTFPLALLHFVPSVYQGLTLAYETLLRNLQLDESDSDTHSDDSDHPDPGHHDYAFFQPSAGDATSPRNVADANIFQFTYGLRLGPALAHPELFPNNDDSDSNSLPSLRDDSDYSVLDSDSQSNAPTIPFFRLSGPRAPTVADNVHHPDQDIDEFYDVNQQEDQLFDPYDYSLNFTPLSMDARAQRIERTIFDSAQRGHYVVTVSVSLLPVGPYHFQYFLDPTEQDLTNVFTIIADKFACQLEELQIQDLSRPFNNDGLTDRLLHPSVWSAICKSISPRPLNINLQRRDSFWRFSLGHMVVEQVGSLNNPTGEHVLFRHDWLQYHSLTEMLVFPELNADLRDRTFLVTVDINIQNAAVSYKRIECSSNTTIAMLQQWFYTQLSEIYPANILASFF